MPHKKQVITGLPKTKSIMILLRVERHNRVPVTTASRREANLQGIGWLRRTLRLKLTSAYDCAVATEAHTVFIREPIHLIYRSMERPQRGHQNRTED